MQFCIISLLHILASPVDPFAALRDFNADDKILI
jgi:hypothetical protein